ncbi:hypothetical protein [Tomitella cavernea]|uniref:Uncharacterized protein n=1 Tax=Tomitella cavernea TaxID=1387982 RepID=A0ABP9C8M0_9ACTN|nr:hypothetical protein [Tomitella cavernea]
MGSIGDVISAAILGSLGTIDGILGAAGSEDMGSLAAKAGDMLGSLTTGSAE